MKLILLLLSTFLTYALFAQTPTKWRGENGNGIYNESNVLKVWPEAGPQMIWSYEGLGEGHSSVASANGELYISGMRHDSIGTISVLSKDGQFLRELVYGTEFYMSYPGSRSTPTIVGNKLYILSGLGVLSCLDIQSGKTFWKKNILKDFEADNIRWGVTESLVVDGDVLYCAVGGTQHNVIALNRHTGELIWSCAGMGGLTAYCTPLLIELPKRKLLVTMMARNILGIDAKTGELLWNYEQTNQYAIHANTPIYHDGSIVCISGYGKGSVKLKLNEDGSNVQKEWFVESFDSKTGGAVLIDGFLYGSGDRDRSWQCINWETGEQTYSFRDISKGNVIAADGFLFCYGERGELALVKADPRAFNPSGITKISMGTAQHWSHPIIDNGVLYVRHGNALMAFKIK